MQGSQARLKRTTNGLLLALIGLLTNAVAADDSSRRQTARETARALDLVEPAPLKTGDEARPPTRSTITLGTTREAVESLLGQPATESVIPSLQRVRTVYPDNTTFIFLSGRVLSISPGADARAMANGSFVIQLTNETVVLDGVALRNCGLLTADDKVKCWIEGSVNMVEPGAFPTGYGDFPYGPPHVYWPSPWPVHAERVMPLRLHRDARPRQYIYYRPYQDYFPSPYIVPSAR